MPPKDNKTNSATPAETELADVSAEISKLQEANADLVNQNKILSDESLDLTIKLDKTEETVEQVEAANKALSETNAALGVAAARHETDSKTLTDKVAEVEKTNQALQETNAMLLDANEKLGAAQAQADDGGKESRGEANVPGWKKLGYNGQVTTEVADFRKERMVMKGDECVCAEGFMECPRTGEVIPVPVKKVEQEQADK